VEFALLGLLEVASGREPVALGHGKESALLAILLLHANEPVAADRIVDALWGDGASANVGKSVQQYVSRLRRRLGPARLETTPGGYMMRVEPGELDRDRFQALAREGRDALDQGDSAGAARRLTDALALWRGPALADFRYEAFAQDEIRRLEGARRTAAADRIDARIALGDEDRALAELDGLIEEDPLWERPRGQLMLALYRAGRQSDALEAYRATRVLFDDELGIEPSRELQELERAILNHDPTLDGQTRTRLRVKRRRTAMALCAAGLALGVLAIAGWVFYASEHGPGTPPGNAVAAFSSSGRLTYTAVGTTPGNIAFGDGGLWVLNTDDRTITHIDPRTGHVVKTFGTSSVPTDLAAGDGALWVGDSASSSGTSLIETGSETVAVSRIDPDSTAVTRTTRLPGTELALFRTFGVSGLAVTANAVWALDPDGTVSRLDPATGRRDGHVPSQGAVGIAAGDGGVWFLTTLHGLPAVAEIDPGTNRVGQAIELRTANLVDIAVGGGFVWASDPYEGVVWQIKPGPKPLTRTIPLGFGTTQLAFGDGALWAANFASGTITRVDPRTDATGAPIELAGTPEDVAVGHGVAWASLAGGTTGGDLPASDCGPVRSGGAKPDVLIASDLPLQGPSGAPTLAAAVAFVLRADHYRAGRFVVGLQSCDDSTARTQSSDFFKCATNARDYAAARKLVAVIGTYDSLCAFVEVPILNRAPSGALAIVSPSTTDPSLTRTGPESVAGSPGIFYPTGARNYLRLDADDNVQGAADALLVGRLGLHRVVVLTDGESYGEALAVGFEAAASHLHLTVTNGEWNQAASDDRALAERVAAARPQAVFLAGYGPAATLVRALRAQLGPHVALIAGDGFMSVPAMLRATGAAAKGMYVSVSLVTTAALTPAGRELMQEFEAAEPAGRVPSGTYLPEMLQAAELVLAAIARSDGTRASVLQQLHAARANPGLLGSFRFDAAGDMTPAPLTILRISGGRGDPSLAGYYRGSVVARTIRAPLALLRPAAK
jgi:DNA-binding SARP family transcriptional activator/ABC-type branched-subunit amino acid transport system substrate-binding protein/streptogramin lyase